MDDLEPLHPAIRGLKTVCRCNNIKYRTIERAVREGARSVADVATKTGAATGECGGSCTPEVQEMIAGLAPATLSGKPGPAEGVGSAIEHRNSVAEPVPGSTASSTDTRGSAKANAWWVRQS